MLANPDLFCNLPRSLAVVSHGSSLFHFTTLVTHSETVGQRSHHCLADGHSSPFQRFTRTNNLVCISLCTVQGFLRPQCECVNCTHGILIYGGD